MKNKILISVILGFFLISGVYAVGETSYCCEKTTSGVWCQNTPQEKCDDNFRMAPTSCESTSFCKLGTCYDSQEGTCDSNTPQKVCEDRGGVWDEKSADKLPQCSLGCCLIGDQAAFVTQTRCKRLSSLYGLNINFRTDISNEIECIASATSEAKGACVFEEEYEKTCLMTTQKECNEMESEFTEVSFHKDYLCSAETLGTNCGPTEKTTCVEGKDEVYFVDSCGNIANIYDSSKINDKNYWSKIKGKIESCGYDSEDGNSDSKTCGNCDYFLGSTCRKKETGETATPKYGDYICRDLSCEYEGKNYQHGETWCADAEGADKNLPGSQHYRLVCYDGEVSVEPCADYRQEICVQSDVNGFKTAACVVNQWQDCISQNNKEDCENADKRDCKWINTEWEPKAGDISGIIKPRGGACVPLYAPGFDFWESESDAEALCSLASVKCVVKYEKGLLKSGKECVENCECLTDDWKNKMRNVCSSIGDCGTSKNYLGI